MYYVYLKYVGKYIIKYVDVFKYSDIFRLYIYIDRILCLYINKRITQVFLFSKVEKTKEQLIFILGYSWRNFWCLKCV